MPKKDIVDMSETGTGPITLDVQMALKLGWSREDLLAAERMINIMARGFATGVAFAEGTGCESCGGIDPTLPDDVRRCHSCKRKNKS